MNYYYESDGEKNMVKDKNIKIKHQKYIYDFNFEKADNYIDEI